ncbi:hypothetical protein SSP531S_41970 [Streptomyces spongiicola]|uniref:Uncharacterized protein n=1 Tax=Streptomyces spongiicola TaxID=1690221 RepID=A0A388T1A9_9ACTN|nr:hypothetical protein [Streptomyces spongiicola]GBQ02733.1 hypothetical protein SSP531S_41970 [Streptomyces spongiicola]
MDHEPAHDTDAVDELAALIQAGGFWRLAPEWVPRTGYASPSRPVLLRVRDGLEHRRRRGHA